MEKDASYQLTPFGYFPVSARLPGIAVKGA